MRKLYSYCGLVGVSLGRKWPGDRDLRPKQVAGCNGQQEECYNRAADCCLSRGRRLFAAGRTSERDVVSACRLMAASLHYYPHKYRYGRANGLALHFLLISSPFLLSAGQSLAMKLEVQSVGSPSNELINLAR